jgi:hypothetical protein
MEAAQVIPVPMALRAAMAALVARVVRVVLVELAAETPARRAQMRLAVMAA